MGSMNVPEGLRRQQKINTYDLRAPEMCEDVGVDTNLRILLIPPSNTLGSHSKHWTVAGGACTSW